MRLSRFALPLILLGTTGAFAHGPQIQLTNDNNKITTREVYPDAPYNVYPAPPSSATSVYVMPLAGISSFGGTAYWVQPNPDFPVNDPGIAWTHGWTYDTSAHTTFPVGSNFVESLNDNLKKWDGTSFTTAAASGAQLEVYKSSTTFGVSGSASNSIALKALAAPTGPADTLLDDHTTIDFQLLGDGIIPSSTHVPAPVADGIYLAQLQLHLTNQPATADPRTPNYDPAHAIQDSDPFYFVLYKGTDPTSALAAAQAAFPSASIQLVPEPGCAMLVIAGAMILRRRRISTFLHS